MPRALSITLLFLLLGCPGRGGGPGETHDPPIICDGKVEISFDEDGNTIALGALKCDGTCADGTACRELTNEAGDRAWCGCPGEPEPALCHLQKARIEGEWLASCVGGCPVTSDVCSLEDHDEELPYDAGRTALRSCACD